MTASLESLNKQKEEHLDRYPNHALQIKNYNGTYVLICEDCGGTWQSFDIEKIVSK